MAISNTETVDCHTQDLTFSTLSSTTASPTTSNMDKDLDDISDKLFNGLSSSEFGTLRNLLSTTQIDNSFCPLSSSVTVNSLTTPATA